MKRFVLLFALLLFSCAPTTSSSVTIDKTAPVFVADEVYRVIDEQAGVVCWVFDGFRAGGISCLPYTQVKDSLIER